MNHKFDGKLVKSSKNRPKGNSSLAARLAKADMRNDPSMAVHIDSLGIEKLKVVILDERILNSEDDGEYNN